MVCIAIVMASGEAVMAIGTGSYNGLAASEVWALLWGETPHFSGANFGGQIWGFFGTMFIDMPAWAVLCAIGLAFIHIFRRRPRRRRLFQVN